MDPHCGWCYGNSKNITALQEEFKELFEIELIAGGMWVGSNAPKGGIHLSQFLKEHTPRLIATTKVGIHQKFFDLAADSTYTFSSLEPCAAIVLVKEIAPEKTILFAKKVQLAIFMEGKPLDELGTYLPIIAEMELDPKFFESHWMGAENLTKTKVEFTVASKLANGFPTLILHKADQTEVLASGYFDLESMISKLKNLN